jgi:hypothetical protein
MYTELQMRVPLLFKVSSLACFSFTGSIRHERIVCLLYAVIMRARNRKNDGFQRLLYVCVIMLAMRGV